MSKPLPLAVVRMIVREWLNQKEPVIACILNGLAEKLAPIAAEHAQVMLLASIDPDPRQALLSEAYATLDGVDAMLQYITATRLKDALPAEALERIVRARLMVDNFLCYAGTREEQIKELEEAAEALSGAKGGAS